MTRKVRPVAIPELAEELRDQIQVRRPWRWWRRLRWLLLGAVALVLVLAVLRTLTLSFPAFSQRAKAPGDGWRILRGLIHVRPDGEEYRQALDWAFQGGMDFVVLAGPSARKLRELEKESPLALLAAEEVVTIHGSFLLLGSERELRDPGEVGARFFQSLSAAGGFSILNLKGTAGPWDRWEVQGFGALEFLDWGSGQGPVGDAIGGWIGRRLGLRFGLAPLTHRAVEGLARWDDANLKGRTMGFCGLDDEPGGGYRLEALVTYVLVPDGLGPWGSAEILPALRAGHAFCGLPILGDPSGFRFYARRPGAGAVLAVQGDEVRLGEGVELTAELNLEENVPDLSLTLLADGLVVVSSNQPRLQAVIRKPGAYRVEASVRTGAFPLGSASRVFVYSNPLFVVP